MRSTLVCLFAVAAISVANPVVEYFLSEIQVAPDSLERIELHMYSDARSYPVDLSGWHVTTNAGFATIDSGTALQNSTDFAIISHENVSGSFSLGDDSDDVWLDDPVQGGGDHYWYGRYGWTPPAGTSVSIYTHWEGVWPYEYLVGDWYLDSTPTFGAPNDDRQGGITGRVLDRFGQPLENCWVQLQNAHGNGGVACDSTGRYVMSPLGPGTYEVSARSDSTYLPAYYPESVSIGVNGWMDSINMTMYPAGVTEVGRREMPQGPLRQRGRTLVLNSDRPGTTLVSVYDDLGRLRMSERVALVVGQNELALPSLSRGVYFALVQGEVRRDMAKAVLW
ncbi:carboxypeptidase regulatory-like domain-containing protein [candidate division WOR-3 bacterium]|uniref:Carboxypeptidase regulatory-like domain-containing protein n=1 Tax=candidate division WOR-3 bacterium TaxID=2052148 RepID=A0A938BUC6_UNCW3|nr:carboxypeptidase regulatory-like domain-containing protein [candidate division WOR-3 bacterium]